MVSVGSIIRAFRSQRPFLKVNNLASSAPYYVFLYVFQGWRIELIYLGVTVGNLLTLPWDTYLCQ